MSTDSGNRKYQALALGTSYALGTFNDNFFKQAGLLLAVTTGNAVFQSQVTFLFALPFVLFSAWSGWLADRFAKKSLVICAKTLELAAMLAGAWGMVTLDWNWMLAMIFCMGLSSTLFSPALNGSIPELFPVGQVPRINALFKLGTTASILFGVFLAGIALDQAWIETAYPFGRWLVAILAVTVAAGGLVSTAFIPAYPGAGSRNPFPWSAVIDSFRFLRTLRKDGPLHLVIWAEAFFYFLSTLLLLEINKLGNFIAGLVVLDNLFNLGTNLVYNDIVESVVGLTLDCARCCNLLVGIECSAVLDIREVLVKLCLNFGFFACLRLYDHDFIKVYAHRRKVDGVVVEKVEVKVYHRLCDLSVGDLLGAYPVDRLEYSLCEILGSALCGLALGAALSLGSSCGAVVACSGAA